TRSPTHRSIKHHPPPTATGTTVEQKAKPTPETTETNKQPAHCNRDARRKELVKRWYYKHFEAQV
ncbi:hypothetical protein A2U01_0098129, partial [Trifolium medium]|nr:hypothetical protein [Trifolium medium]